MASTHIQLLTERALIFCTAGYKHLAPNGARAENVSLCRNGIGSLRRSEMFIATHKKAARLRRSRMSHGVHAHPAPNGAGANFCTAGYKHLAPNGARAENVSLCRNGIGSLRRSEMFIATHKKAARLRRSRMSHGVHAHPAPN